MAKSIKKKFPVAKRYSPLSKQCYIVPLAKKSLKKAFILLYVLLAEYVYVENKLKDTIGLQSINRK